MDGAGAKARAVGEVPGACRAAWSSSARRVLAQGYDASSGRVPVFLTIPRQT